MFGIKKMLKDDDATGIVGGLSACLPSSVIGGGIGTMVTLLGAIITALLGVIPAAWSIVTLPCCFGCGTGCLTGLCDVCLGSVCVGVPLILDSIMATCVGGVTSCFASIGTMLDYILCNMPIITMCLTPMVAGLGVVISMILGAFGISFGAGIGGTGMLFGCLGQNIGAM